MYQSGGGVLIMGQAVPRMNLVLNFAVNLKLLLNYIYYF